METSLGTITIDSEGIVRQVMLPDDAAGYVGMEPGTPFIDSLPKLNREPFEIGLRQLRESGRTWLEGQQLPLDCPVQNDPDLRINGTFSLDTSGPHLICALHDQMSEQEHIDHEFFRSALLSAQQQLTPDGIVIVSPEGRILFYNDRYAEVWGTPPEVMSTESIYDVRKATAKQVVDPGTRFYPSLERLDRSMEISRDELRLKNGRILVRHSAPVITRDGTHLGRFWTYRDITVLRTTQDLLEERTRALELTAQEQEAFIYSASHDLRSPMISIQGLTEILAHDYGSALDDTGRQYITRILANVRRLQEMLSGLLELSRIGRTEVGSRVDVNLQDLVTEIIDDLQDSALSNGAAFIIHQELPTVHANYSRMVQLFSNLLDNALKYTPSDRSPIVQISSRQTTDGWEISVADNGIGIPLEHQKSALNMFSRLPEGQKLNPGGSGLGLAIVSRIVQTHDGALRFDASSGEGTTISFTLK